MLRTNGLDGTFQYRGLNSAWLDTTSRLRVTRYGTQVCLLYSTPDSDRDTLLSRVEFGSEDTVQDGVRLMLHTGAEGLESQPTWQKLTIRATEINGSAVGK